MFAITQVKNKETKAVCLEHNSMGVYKRCNLDIRYIEIVDGETYVYYIENINLPSYYRRYHRVKCNNNAFRFDGNKIKLSDILGDKSD